MHISVERTDVADVLIVPHEVPVAEEGRTAETIGSDAGLGGRPQGVSLCHRRSRGLVTDPALAMTPGAITVLPWPIRCRGR